MNLPSSSPTSLTVRHAVLISAAVVVVGLGIWAIFFRDGSPTAHQNANTSQVGAATPLSFTMLEGEVTNVDLEQRKIDVALPTVDAAGVQRTKTYTLTIGETTVLESADRAVIPATVTPIELSAVAIGDLVSALGDTNLAPLTAFTPTVITRLTP